MDREKTDIPYHTRTSLDYSQTAEDRACLDEMLLTYKNTYAHNNRSASILNSFKSYADESILEYEERYHLNPYKSFIDKGLV